MPSDFDNVEELGDALHEWVAELLNDAEHSTRLSVWEDNFLDDLRSRVVTYRERTRVSPKQMAVLKRIEARLYQ